MTDARVLLIERVDPSFDRWDDLLALILRSFAYMDGVIDPPSSAYRLTPTSLREKAQREIGFVAMLGRRMAGCVFMDRRPDVFYVGKLAVEPGLQGKGIGRALLREAERTARELGASVLELQTRIELTANHRAFARLGFAETARTAHAGFDRPTSITMRKIL